MGVKGSILYGFVIATAILPGAEQRPRPAASVVLDAKAEPTAYEVYAAYLNDAWKDRRGVYLLQQQTETDLRGCGDFVSRFTGEWADAAADFQRQNAAPRTLQPALVVNAQYRVVPQVEIEADDARVAAGRSGASRQVSMEYWAVSAIGFNRDRTKAILHSRRRTFGGVSGGVSRWERKNGRWAQSQLEGCAWVEVLGQGVASRTQSATLEERITQVTGENAVDCGTFSTRHNGVALPIRPSSKATNRLDSMRESLACAEQALKDRKGFKIVQRGTAMDTERSSGLLGTIDGVTFWFDSDSAPCLPLRLCFISFETKPCLLANVTIETRTTGPGNRASVFKCGQ